MRFIPKLRRVFQIGVCNQRENHPEAYGELTSFEIGGHIPMALLMIVPLAKERRRIQAP